MFSYKKAPYLIILLFALFFTFSCGRGGSSPSNEPFEVTNENNTTADDNTTSQEDNTSNSANIIFRVDVPSITPSDEFVCIKFYNGSDPVKMDSLGINSWEASIPLDDTTKYKYCRNCDCDSADEYFDATEKGWRDFNNSDMQMREDNVTKWRWWTPELIALDINTTDYNDTKPANLPRAGFMKGVMLNDYWNQPWHDALLSTFVHLIKDTNATWIEYAPVNNVSTFYPHPKIDVNGSNSTSKDELIYIITKAHENGLKVFINPIPWGLDSSPQDHNATWWQEFHDEYKPILQEYANIAQDNGVEMLAFKMWPSIDELNASELSRMDDLADTLLNAIATIYDGKIAVQSICYDEDKPDLKVYSNANTDYLMMNIWSYYPWALATNKDANVSSLRENFEHDLNTSSNGSVEKFANDHNKSIIFSQVSALAYDSAIVVPAPNDESLSAFNINDDTNYTMDLQEQADVLEAILSVTSQKEYIKGTFIFTYLYWNSIDKDINIRGKPAEKIVKKWYQWF